jgi:hypothetical protein
MKTESWYESLRDQYRPKHLRILLIAESPPDPNHSEKRFFYSPVLRIDNLFRSVGKAVYGNAIDVHDKVGVLTRLRDDGFWLIDAVETPINKLPTFQRKKLVREGVDRLTERCVLLAPSTGVIICHSDVFRAAHRRLRDAGVALLHNNAIPFPIGNWQGSFIEKFRACLRGTQ